MKWDAIFVGGGLASLLAAYRLKQVRPELKVIVLEKSDSIRNHTWSFHGTDLSTDALRWFQPLISRSWTGYDVRFPEHSRSLTGNYHSVDSLEFFTKMKASLGDSLVTGCEVESISTHGVSVTYQNRKESWDGEVVFDGRGWDERCHVHCAFQKFLGLRIEFNEPHGISRPVIMDATVEQKDGYRFFYLLPWSERELLIEDTRYSNGPEVSVETYREEIGRYCEAKGWKNGKVIYEEMGSLPIPLSGFPELASDGSVPWGTRAGFFNATTGYSLPNAVAMADNLARTPRWSSFAIRRENESWLHDHWAAGRYFRFLNRLMFFAATPKERYQILQRFYRLPEGLIERFYAGKLSAMDQVRILSGRPPVPVGRAVRSLFHRGAVDEPRVLS